MLGVRENQEDGYDDDDDFAQHAQPAQNGDEEQRAEIDAMKNRQAGTK